MTQNYQKFQARKTRDYRNFTANKTFYKREGRSIFYHVYKPIQKILHLNILKNFLVCCKKVQKTQFQKMHTTFRGMGKIQKTKFISNHRF